MRKITHNLLFAAVLAASAALGSHAHAQADLTFSGGNGTTMAVFLNNEVKYTVTTYTPAGSLYFDFQNLGIYSFSTDNAFTGTLKYSINGGAMVALDYARSGDAEGSVAAADGYLQGGVPGNSPALPVGTVITLIPGHLLSSGPEDNAPPASGSYQTFLFYGQGIAVTGDGINPLAPQAPEPGTWAMVVLGCVGMVSVQSLRRRAT